MIDKIAMINEVFLNLEAEDQHALLNEIVEHIQKDRALRLQALREERDELLSRSEKINEDISKLEKHIEKLNARGLECDFEKSNAPEHKLGEWAVGKHVKIHSNISGHEFEIGQVVKIVDYDDDGCGADWTCSDGKANWWVREDEATVCEPPSSN